MNGMEWKGDKLLILDQRRLPKDVIWHEYTDGEGVFDAIRSMQVRGAPAIGAAAAYGVALEAIKLAATKVSGQPDLLPQKELHTALSRTLRRLGESRPTAVNLFWALKRMEHVIDSVITQPESNQTVSTGFLANRLVLEANAIAEEDRRTNHRIAENGAGLFHTQCQILTHCNTGALATVEFGTALGIIRELHTLRRLQHVWVDETRPYLQGARLTTFELSEEGIDHTLITDSMAAYFMQSGQVDAVIVGADRIARNGDTANKIGTYGLAVLAKHHSIPFYVAAPTSTFDFNIESGEDIPIEERSPDEVTHIFGTMIAPKGVRARHPAFDVTPHSLITAIVTDRGVIHTPDLEQVHKLFSDLDTK